MTKHDRHRKFAEEEEKKFQPTYQAVLNAYDFNTIADRVCDSMTEPITTFTSA